MVDVVGATQLSTQLDDAERAVDAAIVRLGQVSAAAPGSLIAPLAAARDGLVDLHRALARAAVELGIESALAGPVDKPEDRPTPRRVGR